MLVALCFVASMPGVSVAQAPRTTRESAIEAPNALLILRAFSNTSQPDGAIAHLLTFQPVIPMGPVDVLKAYEDGMTLVAQRLSDELIGISRANLANQITREEADHLILDRYQVAMMQHAVLSALHGSLEHEVARAAKRHDGVGQPDNQAFAEPQAPGQIRLQ